MGSSCSSAQKKKKEKAKQKEGQTPIDGGRRRSTESLPYGKCSPPSSRRPSFEPTAAPLVEQVESPTTAVGKTPVNASLSQASTIGGVSSSPPATGVTGTPITKDAPSVDGMALPDLQNFPEQVRNLIMGRPGDISHTDLLLQPLQEIMLYVAANNNDTAVEREALSKRVFPSLRRYAAEKGYELNIVDFHWGISSLELLNHNVLDLCIQTIAKWKTKKRLIGLVFFNDNVREPILPQQLPKLVFETGLEAMPAEEDRDLFRKYYMLDENAVPPAYFLQPVVDKQGEVEHEKRSQMLTEWKQHSQKMLSLLNEVLPDGQKNKFLTSVLEEEVKTLVTSEDSQEARRVLWMQRRFTHASKPTNSVNPDLKRTDKTKLQLEDNLPDAQKFVLYVRWQEEGRIDPNGDEEHERYITELCSTLKDELSKMVDALIEDDFLREANTPFMGIEKPLYLELFQQYGTCFTKSEEFFGRDSILSQVRDYLLGNSSHPLIILGPEGCGKTCLVAKCIRQCATWIPSAPVVARFVGLTTESSSHEQLLRSILEQFCALYGEHPSVASESVQDWSSGLEKLMGKVSEARPLIVILDGIDEAITSDISDFHWLPTELPPYVKLILTARENSDKVQQIKDIIEEEECFLSIDHITAEESVRLVERLLQKEKRNLTGAQKNLLESSLRDVPCARYSQLLGYTAIGWTGSLNPQDMTLENTTQKIMLQHLLHVSTYLGSVVLTTILGLLLSSKQGLTNSEVVDLLSCEEKVADFVFLENSRSTKHSLHTVWEFAKRQLGLFITSHILGGRTLIRLSSTEYRIVASMYAKEHGLDQKCYSQKLVDYFMGKWGGSDKKPANGEQELLMLNQPLVYGSNPNRRKLEELPYHVLQLQDSIHENFLFDSTWILYKFCGSDPYQFLEDVASYESKTSVEDKELKLLTSVTQLSSYALRCDGSQFFAQMYGRLNSAFKTAKLSGEEYPNIKAIYDKSCRPPLSSLLPMSSICLREPDISQEENTENSKLSPEPKNHEFSGLYTIKGDSAHMISLNCTHGKMTVWNIYEQSAVRKFIGINQPKDIKMVDRYRALVLCNRELKVYHLDQGSLVVKLKGVMNQNMPYYGLHDENYAVSLSRNRMYVNMTNLTTGDLETTFKVGEDRFLNSLLVSANGRICVCGDETQKPFPLLVWDLGSRKLIYDLRIPHHEFVTRLSAISDDGHYVVSVCRELHDTAPNFIIVYDLQSGTLFKKWKPESSSCSIAISSQGGCVVNGLQNTWVLVWDLSTGARRYTLRGHSAPADEIRIEEEGIRCLTYDSKGRDRSLRVWDVSKGECLAVFTPDYPYSCCELSLDGHAVVLGLKDSEEIATLMLCQENSIEEGMPEQQSYGNEERKNKIYDMSNEGQ